MSLQKKENTMQTYNLKIVNDNDAECPLRAWDNYFSFLSCHRRYYTESKFKTIYDNANNSFSQDDFDSLDEIEAFLSKQGYIWVKVYMYSHSGDTISTVPLDVILIRESSDIFMLQENKSLMHLVAKGSRQS